MEDIDSAKLRIADLLDQSVVTSEDSASVTSPSHEYRIGQKRRSWDLSKMDFERLKTEFKDKKYKNIEISDLRAFIEDKLAAKSLLHRLLEEHPKVLVQDWYKDSQSRLRVKSTVEEVLHKNLPKTYAKPLFQKKCNRVFELIYEYASKGLKWAA